MCFGGSSKYERRAAEAQTEALNKLAAAQNAKTTNMVSKTNQTVKTNKDAQKRGMYSLRIPLKNNNQEVNGLAGNSYGLNIPL